MRLLLAILGISTSLLLAACGGGGGGGTTSTPAAPVASTSAFQLRTAYANSVTDSSTHPFTVSGTSSGAAVSGSGTQSNGSLNAATFEGQSGLQKANSVTMNLTMHGISVPIASTSTGYYDSNYNPLGFSGTEYEVVSGTATIPATVHVGDTAILFTTNRFSSSSKTTLLGTTTHSYAVEPDTATTAILKLITVTKNTTNTTTANGTKSIRITPTGGWTYLSAQNTDITNNTILTITY